MDVSRGKDMMCSRDQRRDVEFDSIEHEGIIRIDDNQIASNYARNSYIGLSLAFDWLLLL